MHGMLSAAIMLIVFALVAVVGGGSTVWLYRVASGPGGRSRPPRETTADAVASPVTQTQEAVPGPAASNQDLEHHALGLPAPAEPAEPAEPSVAEPPEGARIYVLDSSRRAGS
jgi:hypothetical protein